METAAVIKADVIVSLEGKPITGSTLKQAALDAALTITPPALPPILVEHDPVDPEVIKLLVPLEWLREKKERRSN
ncbi:hypothetical protein [Bradyrhizobium sp. Arg816]|uniref:hypothetical protein n=1 Tax=Bradyrhizobium sp. Arg816 TaxID=2998491 RepID=UPI00249D9AB5|nr:hypothetical protein [Bradyrhizobium sp. Arg816]MDI3567549.1 hypothetical protein [Bradyrhizobium sp. Arg816]